MMEAKGVSFNFATDRDEPDIRRLLRENSMEGQMHISLEREPDAFAADFGLAKAQDFVVARDLATGEAIGICERAVHNCHINGEPRLMPYIGALRVAASHRNKIAIIKGGFAKLRTIVEAAGTSPFALTSIASENKTALRLLAKGLPGLPRYEAAGELSTCVLRASKTQTPTDVIPPNELADAANQWNAQHQFSQVWKASETEQLSAFGLASQSCLGVQASGVLCGSVGLWDQRKHRQAVVRRYPAILALARPLLSVFAGLTGRPPLPELGQAMNVAVASHFSWADGSETTFVRLINAALARAHHLGISAVAFGFATGGACHRLLRDKFPAAMEFRSTLFKVFWPEDAERQIKLDRRPVHPELGVL
jgi:hypothetical protein